jgi:hypothetical protein
MSTRQNSQKFIGRNRAPRVQIEYDVELYGAQKKVQLPFVMPPSFLRLKHARHWSSMSATSIAACSR